MFLSLIVEFILFIINFVFIIIDLSLFWLTSFLFLVDLSLTRFFIVFVSDLSLIEYFSIDQALFKRLDNSHTKLIIHFKKPLLILHL